MITSIKVKDNGNLSYIIIPFSLFPLVFIGIAALFNLNYLLAFFIMIFLYIVYMILLLKVLKKQEDIYAILADEESITLKDLGTFKWNEVDKLESIDDNPLFTKHPQYYLNIILKSGKNLKINVTNYDYNFRELRNILLSLSKIEG